MIGRAFALIVLAVVLPAVVPVGAVGAVGAVEAVGAVGAVGAVEVEAAMARAPGQVEPPFEPPAADPPVADPLQAPPGAGVPAPGARYAWPLLPAPGIGEPFRAPGHAYGPGHRGVDLVGTAGQAVLAARGGTVVFAGPVAGRPVVSVHHDDGLRTTYEPVRPLVTRGDTVVAGAVLGVLEPGHAGCRADGADGACLHWGLRRGGGAGPAEYLDPLVLLRPGRVRLLPLPHPWPG